MTEDLLKIVEREYAHVRSLFEIQRHLEREQSFEEELAFMRRVEDGELWDREYQAFKERLRKRVPRVSV